jgi:hypothetical protein
LTLTNRELTPEEFKKAVTAKPLHQSKCKALSNDVDCINWKITVF